MALIQRFNKARFSWAVRAMLATPPLARGSVAFTALSMVHHRDVLPYLLALKSLARFLPPAQVVLIADPTIDADDRALLREHVPHIRLRDAAEFHAPGRVQGGTWERLWAIAEYAQDSYVVQLDADTVALRPLADVASAIADGVSFTLGTDDGQQIQATHDVAVWARGRLDGADHTQGLAEACLDKFDPDGRWRYVRGCSGFAGFARGSFDGARLMEVSAGMQAQLGARWSAWGTEQVTSNIIVASTPGARVLPHPRYCAPHRRNDETAFLHFIGYVRHADGLYAQTARDVAADLSAPSARRRAA